MESVPSAKGDHYWALQLKKNASAQEVDLAYRYLSGKYKALVEKGQTQYSELLQLVEEAYAVLSDPEKRKTFDETYQEPKSFREQIDEVQALLKETDNTLASLKSGQARRPIPEWKVEGENSLRTPSPFRERFLFLLWEIPLYVATGVAVFIIDYFAPPPNGYFFGMIAILFVALLVGITGPGKKKLKLKTWFRLSSGIVLFGVHFFTWSQYQLQEFYVDNQTSDVIYVLVDGEPLIEVDSFDYMITQIRPGEHEFKTLRVSDDSVMELFSETIERNNRKMYNVLNAGVYVDGSQTYSSTPFWGDDPGSFERVITGRWIDLHYNYVFEEPPNEISVKRRLGSDNEVTRSYLRRM
jgi:hypothetical protein